MKNYKISTPVLLAAMLLSICCLPAPGGADDQDACLMGQAIPAFLASGVDPNLLLIIDNSASMLDLAYVNGATTCYDDSYSDSTTYAGYFEATTWYTYNDNATDNEFEEITEETAASFCAGAGTEYTSAYLCIDGAITTAGGDSELTGVTTIYLSGNLLNWLSASKLDIQKEILSGGKYDSDAFQLKSESRGCGDRRFIKKVPVAYNADTHYVTFAIRPPVAESHDAWEDGAAYTDGDIVSDDGGDLYKAVGSGTSDGSGPTDDSGVTWVAYWATRWHNGVNYTAGDLVTDGSKANTVDDGRVYIATTSGAASGNGVDDDDGVTWEPYDLTHIEIYAGTDSGYNHTACQAVIDEFASDNPSLGTLKTLTDLCLDYKRSTGSSGAGTADANNAFNHSMHYCWWKEKKNEWNTSSGAINKMENDCTAIYEASINPFDLNSDDRAYICYGRYTGDPTTDVGYVGRCYGTGAGSDCQLVCTKSGTTVADCPRPKLEYQDSDGEPCSVQTGWQNAGYGDVDSDGDFDSDDCIMKGLMDFCGNAEVPEVIDPSDQVGSSTGASDITWGLPAILTDSGVTAQLGDAIYTMKGFISEQTQPDDGLIQEYADDIRMGAMTFNDNGAKSECINTDPYVLYECDADGDGDVDSHIKDGGKVIQEIGQSDSHTDSLVTAINDIKAASWTPLAETMFNAIGYYAQDTSFRLDSDDFATTTDPVIAYCQVNNVLLITEGASTADLASTVTDWAGASGNNDADDADANPDCGALDGSTQLDDLTYYAKNNDALMGTMNDADGIAQPKQNITTYIVVAGTPRNTDDDNECSPDILLENAAENGGTALYTASDPSQLEDQLKAALGSIRAGAAAGSAASVISASRGGEGAVYQAIFWPELIPEDLDPVVWTGEVHALHVNAYGELFEDTNDDRALDASDTRVIIYYDEAAGLSKACNGTISSGVCTGVSKSLDEVDYLWSASEWLAGISPADIVSNRAEYNSNERNRYIYTWNDINNDGDVDTSDEWTPFTAAGLAALDAVSNGRALVPYDFGVQSTAEMDRIVNWVRGRDSDDDPDNPASPDADHYDMRPRKVQTPPNYTLSGAPSEVTLRLGDVVHSTPISVARPAEAYHLLYRDDSYGTFYEKYQRRRHVIYFGGNDGMLHAVNGGFYDWENNKFCLTGNCESEADAPLLGAELWAYVPYNLLPHLKCLTDTEYVHKYYVDLKPRIFDVQIWPTSNSKNDVHPKGWGTILVGGMRFGGGKFQPGLLDFVDPDGADYATDAREFISSYFILDITDPESPPVLLGELTTTVTAEGNTVQSEMGYTTVIPTAVPMKDGNTVEWYLLFGSGPTTLEGWSGQTAKVAVFPLSSLVGASRDAFRIQDATPGTDNTEAGVYTLQEEDDSDGNSGGALINSFISELITVDYDLEENYKTDAVYFGTVEGAATESDSFDNFDWKGRLYRLVTRSLNNGVQESTTPSQWSTATTPSPKVLMNPAQPVTAAPTVGVDDEGNYWVYFGTGRFFSAEEKTDDKQQAFYGIKEPMDCDGEFTWKTVEFGGAHNAGPGDQGLIRVDQISVQQAPEIWDATVSCSGCTLPDGVATLQELENHIVGSGCDTQGDANTGKDGWYLEFQNARERNLGQAALLGGLLNFTTYQPSDDICTPEGVSWLYAVYYLTGTAWHQSVFSAYAEYDPAAGGEGGESPPDGVDASGNVETNKNIGRGLATTPNLHVGRLSGSSVLIQTSTGTIVEIAQPNLPISSKTGRKSWVELTE